MRPLVFDPNLNPDLLTNDAETNRFWVKVAVAGADQCWGWLAHITPAGYGLFTLRRRHRTAHRISYTYAAGPIPEGLVIDHLCRNRACVNPAHLEPVTVAENTRRGVAPRRSSERAAAITHCPQGHPKSGDNLYVAPDGRRGCRVCRQKASHKNYALRSSQVQP